MNQCPCHAPEYLITCWHEIWNNPAEEVLNEAGASLGDYKQTLGLGQVRVLL